MVRYFVIDGLDTWQIVPLNDSELKIIWEQNDEYYFWRKNLSGSILIDKSEFYDHLVEIEEAGQCSELFLIIEKYCNGKWNEYFRGRFSIYFCEFDKDQCTATISVEPEDDYSDILRDIEKEYNIMSAGDAFTTAIYALNYNVTPPTWTLKQNYINGRLLDDVMDFFAAKYSLTYRSDFFVNADPIAGKDLSKISLHDITDVKHPTYSSLTITAEYSLKQLLEILHYMFYTYWYIENGELRVEHSEYFNRGLSYSGAGVGLGFDLTHLVKVNKYKYISVNMPYLEKWIYMNGQGGINTGWGTVEYSKACTTSEVRDRIMTLATANVYWVWRYFDKFPDEGLVVLQNEYNATATSIYTTSTKYKGGWSIYSGDIRANENFFWDSLIKSYWKYDRVLIEGLVCNDTVETTFKSTQRNKEGSVKFQLCCQDFDPYKIYTTVIGGGKVKSATERLKDSQMELTLRYE